MEKILNLLIVITQYKWAGSWGPFTIKSHCEECDLTTHTLRLLMEKELEGKNVVFEIKPWLGNAWHCLKRGAWHPPIIMVNGKMFYQFTHKKPLFDKTKLLQLVSGLLGAQQQG